ncbi:MAG: helix-turn-helix domain-containing protein [Anaerolineae bacterium]|nr:helix-turn-helix domain-containing protein [Anaerolineae bacterium]
MSDLGDWLADELARRGWSHNELARRAGVSQPNVSAIVKGQNPGCDFCIKIAAALSEAPEKVLRLASILPPSPAPDDSPTLQEIVELARSLSPEDRTELLEYARFRYQRRKG